MMSKRMVQCCLAAWLGLLANGVLAASAGNHYVTVGSDTVGVEEIVPVDDDFYVTTRGVGAPDFIADISVSPNFSWRLVYPSSGKLELGIGASDLYEVEDSTGSEDSAGGRIEVLKLDIAPSETNICWKSSGVTLSLTSDSALGGGTATWSSVPTGIDGSGTSIVVNPGSLAPGEYVVTAQSSIVPSYADTCVVRIIKVDIVPDTTNFCWNATSALLSLTPDSYLGGGTANWTSDPVGVSGSGTSIIFNPSGLTPGAYVVTARSSVLPNCTDTCTVNVVKVDIEQAVTNVCWESSSVSLNLTMDSYLDGGTAIWTSEPAGISGSGTSITFNPSGLTPGAYVVTARSSVLPNCSDTCVVQVIHVEITPDTLSGCPRCLGVPVFSLTNSFTPNGVSWVISPQGAGCAKNEEDSTHVEIDVGSVGNHYTITAISKDCPDANDSSDLSVFVPSDIEQIDKGYSTELVPVNGVDVVTVTKGMIHGFSPSPEGASAGEHFCFIQKFRGTVLKDGVFATVKMYGTNIVTLNSSTWRFDSANDKDPVYNSEESSYGHTALGDNTFSVPDETTMGYILGQAGECSLEFETGVYCRRCVPTTGADQPVSSVDIGAPFSVATWDACYSVDTNGIVTFH